ncbi:MAG: transglycosylase domain-containing protein [bacterium]|nr:transglycosylase domain-containing protein [bacterium]
MSVRRWIVPGLCALLIPAFLVVAGLLTLYSRGLRLVGPLPTYDPVAEQSPLIRAAFFAELEGPVPPELRRLGPLSFVSLVICEMRRNDCPRRYPGFRTASLLARELAPEVRGNFERQLAQASLAVWLTRNWSLDEMLDTFAHRAYFQKEVRGIDQASRVFFDADPSELRPDQVATLAVFTRGPAHFIYLAVCEPEGFTRRRNMLLKDMESAGTLNAPATRLSSEDPTTIRPAGVECR